MHPYKNFLPKLKDHLLGRLIGREFDGDMEAEFSDSDRNSVHIVNNKIYSVHTCRIYYTIGMGSGRVRLAYNSKLEARRFLVAAGVHPCVKILLCQRGLRHLTPIYYRQPLCAGRCILLAYIPILMTGISLG